MFTSGSVLLQCKSCLSVPYKYSGLQGVLTIIKMIEWWRGTCRLRTTKHGNSRNYTHELASVIKHKEWGETAGCKHKVWAVRDVRFCSERAVSKFCNSPLLPPLHEREAALAAMLPCAHPQPPIPCRHLDLQGRDVAYNKFTPRTHFALVFRNSPSKHNAIFSILSNTDTKFVDFHVPCSIKGVSQKRLASLVVELLSVITRLKYKLG